MRSGRFFRVLQGSSCSLCLESPILALADLPADPSDPSCLERMMAPFQMCLGYVVSMARPVDSSYQCHDISTSAPH